MKKMMLAFMLILLFQATTATAEASLTLWEPQGNIVCFISNTRQILTNGDLWILTEPFSPVLMEIRYSLILSVNTAKDGSK